MVLRPQYMNTLRQYRDVPLVKILAGIRRCGKSTILEMLRDDLIAGGVAVDHVIFLRYTSEDFDEGMTDRDMYKDIRSRMTGEGRYYLLLDEVQEAMVGNPSAKAAADIALWDLYSQYCGLPVYKMLGGGTPRLETDLTISVNSPEIMATDAEYGIYNGYNVLKIKVGIDPELDFARLAAVRGAAKTAKIRIDANQAWTPKQAVRLLNRMQDAGLDIELVEQPVKAYDLEGLKFVTANLPVPVLADESVFSPRDALRIMQERAADMVNIKLMKCGGLTNALRIVSAAEVYGVECMMGCMLEAKVSVTAAAHLACARSVITRIDLDGPALCSEDPVEGGAIFEGSTISLTEAPGLGITGIDGLKYII